MVFLITKHHINNIAYVDQGIVKSLKAKYRKNTVEKTIRSLGKSNAMPEVLILKAMQMLVSAWNAVSTKTIVNCFRKSGISTANQEATIAKKDYHSNEIFNQILYQKMSTQLHY